MAARDADKRRATHPSAPSSRTPSGCWGKHCLWGPGGDERPRCTQKMESSVLIEIAAAGEVQCPCDAEIKYRKRSEEGWRRNIKGERDELC